MFKKLVIVFVLQVSFQLFSQVNSNMSTTESEKYALTMQAEFPGGDKAFQAEFMKMVHAYIDIGIYAVNGKFTFIINISDKGKTELLQIFPKVKNSEEFFSDMAFAIKRIKKKWKPALKDGKPVNSRYIATIDFTSDYADHGD